ncbi:hypothetical protein C8R43DRAFT_586180 [Mycena crocata]|nr:hypothetical protein C8R43DRAFT_586180 [Mycena crocata]
MRASPPTCLPVQELWDHIISFLAASREDLLACSSVCWSLAPASQSHLFSEIVFLPAVANGAFGEDTTRILKYDEVAACLRLCRILRESPHLIHYIRCIKVHLDPRILTPLTAIGLSNLREIYLRKPDYEPATDGLAQLAQRLLGLPTVERVRVWAPPQSTSFFDALFAGGSTQLKAIHIFCMALLGSTEVVRPVAQRSPITDLRLDMSLNMGDWFVQPGCPLDFSGLRNVYLHDCMKPSLLAILHRARHTIQHLRLSAMDIVNLDLNAFPALTQLTISMSDPEDLLPDVATALARLNDENSIRTIALEIPAWGVTPRLFGDFDTALAVRSMSSLDKLEVWLEDTTEEDERPNDEPAFIRTLFPRMHAKNMLVVPGYYRGHKWIYL